MTHGRIRTDRLRATASFYGSRRDQRPSDLRGDRIACPFCPGNEAATGALLTPDPGPAWQSRVIANLYPAVVEPDGRHEVIVETRAHDVSWTLIESATIERILRIYREREATGYADGHRFVAIFKNSGASAGASLAHPHAQVVALRTIPLPIIRRIERLTAQCDICFSLAAGNENVVGRFGDVIAYVPTASRMAFEVRLAPFAHSARFSDCADSTLACLADAVADTLKRLAAVLGEGVPFNMIVQSAPCDARAQTLMHWEIELVPRNENFGGFEVGTGGFLVSRAPEDAARRLKAAAVTHA